MTSYRSRLTAGSVSSVSTASSTPVKSPSASAGGESGPLPRVEQQRCPRAENGQVTGHCDRPPGDVEGFEQLLCVGQHDDAAHRRSEQGCRYAADQPRRERSCDDTAERETGDNEEVSRRLTSQSDKESQRRG